MPLEIQLANFGTVEGIDLGRKTSAQLGGRVLAAN